MHHTHGKPVPICGLELVYRHAPHLSSVRVVAYPQLEYAIYLLRWYDSSAAAREACRSMIGWLG